MTQCFVIQVGVAQTGGPVVERIDLEQAADEGFPFLMVPKLVVIGLPQQIEPLRKSFVTCQAALQQDEGLPDLAAASLQGGGKYLQHGVAWVLFDQLLCIGLGHVGNTQSEVAVCGQKWVLELGGTDSLAISEPEVGEEGVVGGE